MSSRAIIAQNSG